MKKTYLDKMRDSLEMILKNLIFTVKNKFASMKKVDIPQTKDPLIGIHRSRSPGPQKNEPGVKSTLSALQN